MNDLKTLAMAAKENGDEWYQVQELLDETIDITSDAEFINAASPDAILKLLEERDRLREALTAIKDRIETCNAHVHYVSEVFDSFYTELIDSALEESR